MHVVGYIKQRTRVKQMVPAGTQIEPRGYKNARGSFLKDFVNVREMFTIDSILGTRCRRASAENRNEFLLIFQVDSRTLFEFGTFR